MNVTEEDEKLIGHMVACAAKIAKQEGIAENGYRLIVNCNRHGGQEVFHIHMQSTWRKTIRTYVGSLKRGAPQEL